MDCQNVFRPVSNSSIVISPLHFSNPIFCGDATLISPTESATLIATMPNFLGTGYPLPFWRTSNRILTPERPSPFTTRDGRALRCSRRPSIAPGTNSFRRAPSTAGPPFGIPRSIGRWLGSCRVEKWSRLMERTWDTIFPTKTATAIASVSIASRARWLVVVVGLETLLLILFLHSLLFPTPDLVSIAGQPLSDDSGRKLYQEELR